MKLVVVLMLSALPLFCYAASGCASMEDMIVNTLNPSVTEDQYIEGLEEFIPADTSKQLLVEFRQCFLDQSNRTLSNVQVMMDAIYNSRQCASY
ncbi:mammaglobin-B-like [Myotis yumanensis]|uniref:mammaglobin-B-like n=1 Tax=Myotis yumanensis TaxID=159337 RepID=UPI0038D4A7AE